MEDAASAGRVQAKPRRAVFVRRVIDTVPGCGRLALALQLVLVVSCTSNTVDLCTGLRCSQRPPSSRRLVVDMICWCAKLLEVASARYSRGVSWPLLFLLSSPSFPSPAPAPPPPSLSTYHLVQHSTELSLKYLYHARTWHTLLPSVSSLSSSSSLLAPSLDCPSFHLWLRQCARTTPRPRQLQRHTRTPITATVPTQLPTEG